MKVEKARVEEVRLSIPEGFSSVEKAIEHYGRICYRSEDKVTPESAERFVSMLVKRKHHAMLEFCDATVIYSCDRGMSHEQVRHRLVTYAQESTRYCNYGKGKFGAQITVIEQPTIEKNPDAKLVWEETNAFIEKAYLALLEAGIPPQSARSILPIGLKTRIAVKTNLREWMTIFSLRCDTPAHEIIRECSTEVLRTLHQRVPSIFQASADQFLAGK